MPIGPARILRKFLLFLVIPAIFVSGIARADEEAAFPELDGLPNLTGTQIAVASPNGRFVLRAVATGEEEPANNLVIENTQSHASLNLMQIERNVDIGWRADSGLFFVNDNYGSNLSDCEIFRPFEVHPVASIAEETSKKLKLFSAKEDAVLSHVYFSCLQWIGANEVLIVVYGHYDAPDMPFTNRHLVYDLSTRRFVKVK